MPAGRKPKPANMIDNDVSKYSKEKTQTRINNEPKYFGQEFICPDDFSDLEKKLWDETTGIFKQMQNCPICDADTRAIRTYVEWLALGITAKKNWKKNGSKIYQLTELGKDKHGEPKFQQKKDTDYQMMLDSSLVCDKLRKSLCLDVESRARVGSAKSNYKDNQDVLDILNNRSD